MKERKLIAYVIPELKKIRFYDNLYRVMQDILVTDYFKEKLRYLR